jgi:hypothetical protein
MARCKHVLPGFRAACLTVCGLYIVLAGGLLLRGVGPSMAPFAVPPVVLDSPHYHDAIVWVYTHQLVIGALTGVIGVYAEGPRFKRAFARAFVLAHVVYTYLDLRSSDSALGDGLYHGPGSLVPVAVCLLVTLLFAHVSLCPAARGE